MVIGRIVMQVGKDSKGKTIEKIRCPYQTPVDDEVGEC